MPMLKTAKWERRERLLAYAYLAPACLVVLLVIVYPLLTAVSASLRQVDVYRPELHVLPVTLGNYAKMLTSATFLESLRNSAVYVLCGTGGSLLLGLATALLLNRQLCGTKLLRMLIILPWPVPGVVAALIFQWIFDASFGVVNYILLQTGLIAAPVQWLVQADTAFMAVTIATVWKGYPFFTMSFLAGLQAIPADLYEAASIDGAGRWEKFKFITLPALNTIMRISVVISALWVFREFAIIDVMTGGGPFRSTETAAVQVYLEAFRYYHLGYASAIGMILLTIAMIFSIIFLRLSRREFF